MLAVAARDAGAFSHRVSVAIFLSHSPARHRTTGQPAGKLLGCTEGTFEEQICNAGLARAFINSAAHQIQSSILARGCRKDKILRIQQRASRSRYIWRQRAHPHPPLHPVPTLSMMPWMHPVCIPDMRYAAAVRTHIIPPLYTHAACSGVTGEVLSRRWISMREALIWIIDHQLQ